MRFLVDECTGPAVADWLRSQGHEVVSVFDELKGISDDKIIETAIAENRILITNDKDFGEKVFRNGMLRRGIILLRLENETASSKISVLLKLFRTYSDRLSDSFIVVTEKQARFAHK
jgi:predicted nuclease of predicted toxin-antitoxin system